MYSTATLLLAIAQVRKSARESGMSFKEYGMILSKLFSLVLFVNSELKIGVGISSTRTLKNYVHVFRTFVPELLSKDRKYWKFYFHFIMSLCIEAQLKLVSERA